MPATATKSIVYCCSECDRALEDGEDCCPDHPDATVLTVLTKTARAQLKALRAQAARLSGTDSDRARTCTENAAWRYPDLELRHRAVTGGGWDPTTLLARPFGSRRWREIV